MKTSLYIKSSKGLPHNHLGRRFKADKRFLRSLEVKHKLPDEYKQTLRAVIIFIAYCFIATLIF